MTDNNKLSSSHVDIITISDFYMTTERVGKIPVASSLPDWISSVFGKFENHKSNNKSFTLYFAVTDLEYAITSSRPESVVRADYR